MIAQQYFDKIKEFFNGDIDKVWQWFRSPHPALGNVSPLEMIKQGRASKLYRFINDALDGNKRTKL